MGIRLAVIGAELTSAGLVLADTLLVRSVLVPALVTELGDRVWWPPAAARGAREGAGPAPR